MLREWPYLWVDVFAPRQLSGNPLCVFTEADGLSDEAMARITREIGHSETAFLQSARQNESDRRVRIWIPTGASAMEVPFAGHPILGSACAAAVARREPSTISLESGVGAIPVAVAPAGEGHWEATMEQPLPRLVWSRPATPGLAEALGLAPSDLLPLPVEAVDNGLQTVIIPLASVAAVDRCRPEMAALRSLLGRDGLSTMVFAMGGVEPGSDLHCRVFGPFGLVPEDPATGSANGPLGLYVLRHGLTNDGLLVSEQGDQMGRASRIRIQIDRDAKGEVRTLQVGGSVHLVGRGVFAMPSL